MHLRVDFSVHVPRGVVSGEGRAPAAVSRGPRIEQGKTDPNVGEQGSAVVPTTPLGGLWQ